MSGVLVDYGCAGCGTLAERRVPAPPPGEMQCERCGGVAKRKFGFRVGAAADRVAAVSGRDGHGGGRAGHGDADHGGGHAAHGGSGDDHAHGFGTCGLIPTAARALTARLQGDERGLEREFRAQERMISEGSLDPAAGPRGVSPVVAAEVAAATP